MADDPATGARIGVPGKLVPQGNAERRAERAGHRAQGNFGRDIPHRRARHDARRACSIKRRRSRAGRKARTASCKPDFFVISGMQGLKKFYVRAQLRADGEVRGFTVLYDQAMEGTMDPMVVRDVERLRAVLHRLRGGGRAARRAARSNTPAASSFRPTGTC